MTLKVKEIIRDIKLYELGIKDKPDGYDTLMSLRGLNPFKTDEIIHYGKTIDDIKFIHDIEYIYIKKELWYSIGDSFTLLYDGVQELTMWSIGSEPNLKGIFTTHPL